MADPNPSQAASPTATTSAWPPLLILPALGSIGLGVLLPAWLFAVALSTTAAVFWCKGQLERLHIQSTDTVVVAFLAGLLLVIGGLGAAAWGTFQAGFHPRTPAEQAPRPKGLRRWLQEHPWWSLGAALLVSDILLLPRSGHWAAFPRGAAITIVATTSWSILTSVWLFSRMAWGALRLGWRLSRRNSAVAALVVMAGVATATGWVVFVNVVDLVSQPEFLQELRREQGGRRAFSSFGGGGRFTAGEAEVPAALFEHEQLGALALAPVHLGDPGLLGDGSDIDLPDSFAACAEQLHPLLRTQATLQAARFVGPSDAEDVVQEILLRVCLRRQPPRDFGSFFIKAVQYRASTWQRRAVRNCPLYAIPEQVCDIRPDEEYLRLETLRAANKALCTLTDSEQEILRLRYFERKEYFEIAAALGISEANARQRVSRSTAKLRAAFQQLCR